MSKKSQPGTRFLKNNFCTFAQKDKPNFDQRDNICSSILRFIFSHFILNLRSPVLIFHKNSPFTLSGYILGDHQLAVPLAFIFLLSKSHHLGHFLAVQWLGFCALIAQGTGFIPRLGTKMLQAIGLGQKQKVTISGPFRKLVDYESHK